jgi:negative elongation factor C/D
MGSHHVCLLSTLQHHLFSFPLPSLLSTQGYEDEVAQVGGSLASYFDVYHRLLVSRLSAAAQAQDAKQLRSIAREIASSSVDNQHTYVHAQQLLSGK